MAASVVRSDLKPSKKPPRDGPPSSPETSFTWCVAHLSRSGSGHHGAAESRARGRDGDRRSGDAQWRALYALRTQHIKKDNDGIVRFRRQGGLRPLLDLIKHPKSSRKTLDAALSILADCCRDTETREEVRKLDGINIVVDVLKRNMAMETVQNRAARALGNLAKDPESSVLVHSAGGVPLLLHCLSLPPAPSSPTPAPPKDKCPKVERAQSAARALRCLSDTPSNRLSLLGQGAFSALAPLIAPECPPELRREALGTLHELSQGCDAEHATGVSQSGALAHLSAMASEEELALKTLAHLCSQGCLRPLLGSLGVIQKFIDKVKKDPQKSGVFLKALCLCCKEGVNRVKVRESGGLEVLIGFLSAQSDHPLAWLPILACVDFVYDEAAMEQLQELGLVPLLVARLVKLTRGEEEESADKMDASLSAGAELLPSSCFESFDFPAPEGCRKEEAGKEQGSSSFLSLRSWLVSEGLISSEEELLDSSVVEGEWAGSHVAPPSSSPQTSSPNPYSGSSLKTSLAATSPIAAVPKKKAPPPLPSSSSSSSCKATDPPPSTPPPPSGSTSSSPSPSSKTLQTPVSPSKFSSSHRKRQRSQAAAAACLTKLCLDTPPSVPRPPYYHPYHPEPWTPESPILLLLSRFSHASDPSAALVSSGAVPGLLLYLTQRREPSSRCFRMLAQLSCNPNCLQALVRTGSVALIRHLLCQPEGGARQGAGRQTDGVKAKVKQLGVTLLNNLRVQCESGFGSGVLAHVMLSGSETDKVNCALSLPLVTSNKSLLKKLLLDSGGLSLALQPLDHDEDDAADEEHAAECGRFPSDVFIPPHSGGNSLRHSLYFSLLSGCLSTLTASVKTELGKKRPVATRAGGPAASAVPPPSKRARLAHPCPYAASSFDLVLLLDDGTRVPANREAVAGGEDGDGAGSEYFRALLRGGFGEAQGGAGEAIKIKDVTAGMLVPVLHYLHGCRLAEEAGGGASEGPCETLETVVLHGLRFCQTERSDDGSAFQETPLGEAMIGACRFLVGELQRQLEDVCVSLLLSCSSKAAVVAAPVEDGGEKTACRTDQDCPESAAESLAVRTSELELSGPEKPAESSRDQTKRLNSPLQETEGGKASALRAAPKLSRGGAKTAARSSAPAPKSVEEPLDVDEPTSIPKIVSRGAAADGGGGARCALLAQVYWFSQRHSYLMLRRACLSLLLGCQDCPRLLPPAAAGDGLRRLAREAECTAGLKQDLLSLASAALS